MFMHARLLCALINLIWFDLRRTMSLSNLHKWRIAPCTLLQFSFRANNINKPVYWLIDRLIDCRTMLTWSFAHCGVMIMKVMMAYNHAASAIKTRQSVLHGGDDHIGHNHIDHAQYPCQPHTAKCSVVCDFYACTRQPRGYTVGLNYRNLLGKKIP